MIQQSIKIEGIDEMRDAFNRSPLIVTKEIMDAIKRALILLEGEAKKGTPVDTNFLRGSNKLSFSILSGKLYNDAPYALFVHEGTRPHFPPVSALEPWARRHKIPAFVVARSIAQKGTSARPFYDEAVDAKDNEVQSIFDKALENIVDQLAQ